MVGTTMVNSLGRPSLIGGAVIGGLGAGALALQLERFTAAVALVVLSTAVLVGVAKHASP